MSRWLMVTLPDPGCSQTRATVSLVTTRGVHCVSFDVRHFLKTFLATHGLPGELAGLLRAVRIVPVPE